MNEDQNCGELPTSVGGGDRKEGSAPASVASCGPGVSSVLGSVTLTAPCGGWFGLPKVAAPAAVAVPTANPAGLSPAPAADEPGVTYIKSPMVGTFYGSSSPDSAPFVEVNQRIEEGSIVCIIEAMKIMNEIQAETKGVILEVLVENGQPVEYGQRLFRVKTN